MNSYKPIIVVDEVKAEFDQIYAEIKMQDAMDNHSLILPAKSLAEADNYLDSLQYDNQEFDVIIAVPYDMPSTVRVQLDVWLKGFKDKFKNLEPKFVRGWGAIYRTEKIKEIVAGLCAKKLLPI